jgi:hypothetical protein
MGHSLLRQLELHRGIYLWGCWRLVLELEVFRARVSGEIAFLFGTEADPNKAVVYLDTMTWSWTATRRCSAPAAHLQPAWHQARAHESISTRGRIGSEQTSRS